VLNEIALPRTHVESSVLRAVGYETSTGLLEAEFQSGAVYAYEAVPPQVFDALLAAHSKGTFFNREIRNAYSCLRVSPPA
jgi:hypothetical protein